MKNTRKIKYANSEESKKELKKFIKWSGSVSKAAKYLSVTRCLIYNWKSDVSLIQNEHASKMQEFTKGLCKKDILLSKVKLFHPGGDFKNLYEYILEMHVKPKLAISGMSEDDYFKNCLSKDISKAISGAKTKKYEKALIKIFITLYGRDEEFWKEVLNYYIK